MAGQGIRLFQTGAVLTAAQINQYLMDQSIHRFATTTARATAYSAAGVTLAEGMFSYIDSTNKLYYYSGSAWEEVGAQIEAGEVTDTEVSATAAIAHSKLANATAGQVLLGTTTTVVMTASTISGDITINGAGVATIAANSVALGTDTTGNYVNDITAGTGVTVTHTPGEGSSPTVEIGQAVGTGASVTFASISATGSIAISGRIDKTTLRESVSDTSVSAGVVTADYSTGDIFYIGTAPSNNFTVNLTNAPTDNGKAISVVLFVTQGATGYIPSAVQVAGSAQTIKWANGAAPTPTSSAGKIDIFSFTFVRRSAAWTVFGSSNLGY